VLSRGPARTDSIPLLRRRPRREAKARGWIDDIRVGAIASFAEIAEREAQGERHIRLLTPLAFLSPRIIAAIVDGTAPADLTVTGLAKALPYSWAEQEERVGLSL
jgi:site-specific DNA recombinase